MEIQATSGEWMNEFVRRPSRRRDNRVYVPAADIIKRTIRRSWTISNPSTRWNAPRAAPEMRPYNSLPRGQDINSYPSLRQNQHQESGPAKTAPTPAVTDRPDTPPRRHSPARRTHSEDVYPERTEHSPTPRSPRINPLILYAQKDRATRTGRKKKAGDAAKEEDKKEVLEDTGKVEKRVSFENCAKDLEEIPPRSPRSTNPHFVKAASLNDTPSRIPRRTPHYLQAARSLQERSSTLGFSGDDHNVFNQASNSASSLETLSSGGTGGQRDDREFVPVELCDIEPLSGTVFRKVTVRRRRQDMRKMQAVDSDRRRRDSESLEVENDEYRLVFISSDSSSKEEDPDDNDSSSTASSFPIEECDWDYFEPGATTTQKPVLTWNSPPFGSPRVYRRSLIESPLGSPSVYRKRESDTGTDDDYARIETESPASSDSMFKEEVTEDGVLQCKHKPVEKEVQPCRSCGAFTQYIPIPVPVPIPVPIPTMWTAQEAMKFYASGNEQTMARLPIFPRNLWPFLNTAALMWPLMESVPTQLSDLESHTVDAPESVSQKHQDGTVTSAVLEMDANEVVAAEEVGEISGYLESENRYDDSSTSSTETDDSEYNERKKRCVTRVYNVNGRDGSRESDDALPSSNLSSCDEEDGRTSRQSTTSSCTSYTEDSDDTGTDQKPKKFSKIFVVNKDMDDSSSQRSTSSESTSSDNDTDTELDCTVILQNIKSLPEEQPPETDNHQNDDIPDPTEIPQSIMNNAQNDRITDLENPSETTPTKLNNEEIHDPTEMPVDIPDLGDLTEKASTGFLEARDRTEVDIREPADLGIEARVVGRSVPEERSSPTCCGEVRRAPGASVAESGGAGRNAARYTSLVMITQETSYQQVSVVTSDTTRFVEDDEEVVVKHTNWQDDEERERREDDKRDQPQQLENVTVITGADTLSAFEEGLADDDSWVENISHDEDDFGPSSITEDSSSGEEVTLTCSVAVDNEDELRGYHRTAIDFTLHTIVEESCEESEVEHTSSVKKQRPASATDLEKYFFFGLGDGNNPSLNANREDAFSETSSVYSEGLDSLGGPEEQQSDQNDPAELASSRLEKYFLSGFMGFNSERRDSDGSVGSDSEGRRSPEQRRKRLVRARGTGRSHSSSLDNLLSNPELSGNEQQNEASNDSEHSSSSDSDTYDETTTFEKSEGQFDTVKRKKNKKHKSSEELKSLETTQEVNEFVNSEEEDEDGHKTPQPENTTNLVNSKNQQSRDSGFIGSCDDLLREQRDPSNNEGTNKHEARKDLENILEERKEERSLQQSVPPTTALTRKDSFNNWSSDEETNLMMCKMRQFFKTMIANSQCPSSKPATPNLSNRTSPIFPSPRLRNRCKPPQLVYFENELTRLMKTVPGIRDDQVREIVEYLSSEDTWSDSYDSSDYTSSDLEGTTNKTALQQQISDSCKQIINKFDNLEDEEGDEGDGGIMNENLGVNKETSFVYQKLVASFEKMASGDNEEKIRSPNSSPTLIARVMHHIGSRLVALMHEVSSGESHASNSPKARHYHRRLQQKLSNASSTTTDDDSTSDAKDTLSALEDNFTYSVLSRSKSHDLLMGETKTSNQTGSGDIIVEEREASDCERFSWRGSFESALLATDSRNRLSMIGSEGSASASALAIAAKRRSAGDLIFSHKSLSREQLDRVRSCGSIGGASSEDKLWVSTATRPNRRRSSVPDASCGSGGSAGGEDDDEEDIGSSLPRNLQSGAGTANSLPRLPTNTPPSNMQKAQSHHFLPQNAKSARYRPPGFNRPNTTVPKRAVSAPGLQPTHQRRGRRSQQNVPSDDVLISEAQSSPTLGSKSKSATPSPIAAKSRSGTLSSTNSDWQTPEEDIDRMIQGRGSLSGLGLRSDSMASVYSGAGEGRYGTVAVRGQVEFGLQYNYKAGALEIHVKQCKDLAPVDTKRNRSDPYVKVYLLPDKSKSGKRKTKVKKHTLNPVFDETLKFHISLNGLETRTLWLTVWHSDMFGRNDFLGEVMMSLENKVFDDPAPVWYNLQERTEPFDDTISFKGDIIVCLKFVPPDMTVQKKGKRSRGTLHVLVKEAKYLTAYKANGTSDPFCKSYLLPDKGRNSKQKTPVVKKTVNPVWNHTFIYEDVTLQELAERCLELTVWDHDRLASNEFLGGVRFSLGTGKHYGKPVEWMDATGKEMTLWKSMLERPNFWVEGCLSLRPSLDARTS